MASSVTIDVDSEKQDADLQFQDIPHDDEWGPIADSQETHPPGKTHTFTNFPHSAADSDDDDSEKTEFLKDKKNASFWTFEYYQQFFDVETRQVGGRILGSMMPRPGRNYLDSYIRPNPDLYGPFWICTMLVFTTAIAGNLANYIQAAGQNYHWVYDFHKVTFAATAIFSYWWVVPLLLFALLWWRGNPERYTFLELICLYGYSLAIYIPISLLWVIPLSWLQWLLVVLGAVLSGSALLLAVWPAVREDKKQVAIGVMALIFLLHAALAMGFMLYFFHVPGAGVGPTTVSPANVTTAAPHPPQAFNQQAPQNPSLQQNGPGNPPLQQNGPGNPPLQQNGPRNPPLQPNSGQSGQQQQQNNPESNNPPNNEPQQRPSDAEQNQGNKALEPDVLQDLDPQGNNEGALERNLQERKAGVSEQESPKAANERAAAAPDLPNSV